jgi:hypothetical protein
MKLAELDPRWIHPNVFAFLCPCCRKWMLPCKNAEMSSQAQFDLYEKVFGDDWPSLVVPAKDSFCWTMNGTNFDGMTVTPSIDASASGHWHGHITDGEITP